MYTYIHGIIVLISLPFLSLFGCQAISNHAHVRSWGRLQSPSILSGNLKEANCTNQVNVASISRSIQQRTLRLQMKSSSHERTDIPAHSGRDDAPKDATRMGVALRMVKNQ